MARKNNPEHEEKKESPQGEGAQGETISTLPSELGAIRIADNVVAIIAGLASAEVEGVASMSGGITGGIAEALGRKNLSRGVKVEVGQEEAIITLYLIVKYGTRIAEVSKAVQKNVKEKIEEMTGLNVKEVIINVQGIELPQAEA